LASTIDEPVPIRRSTNLCQMSRTGFLSASVVIVSGNLILASLAASTYHPSMSAMVRFAQ
jgi:hypothetical protein